MFTIHNMDNSGECRQEEFSFTGAPRFWCCVTGRADCCCLIGVPGEVFATVEKALDERTIGHNPERLSLMKVGHTFSRLSRTEAFQGAMIYANCVTTVSPTYAREVLDGGAAGWLRGVLGRAEIRSKIHGILNGSALLSVS